ncbi:helix-turn-helix transcriptional regulator (plasmid) [Halarchaeum sp. CBA1220]|uniref:winged helix-turn-helix domain-containing protein n=1 Tax=Halarchaeum sp. CBA1220 TaxID=1853682 RepID=UPI000F3AA819|nr:helix-turn-helix domain-containing protein [Halarchaeum sp. CBA1220]QLC34896.1 helix-turn-helix transcriptional regulator [Halarchaeum sp. CBA1220]
MSQSATDAIRSQHRQPATPDDAAVTDPAAVQDVLDVLDDADCQAILEATSADARSASELAERCDIPLSTVYRKLEALTDAGFLAERTRVRRSGRHANEYERCVEEVTLSVDGDGSFALRVERR